MSAGGWLNLWQAAQRLGISTIAAEDLVRHGALDARVFITAESVEEYARVRS